MGKTYYLIKFASYMYKLILDNDYILYFPNNPFANSIYFFFACSCVVPFTDSHAFHLICPFQFQNAGHSIFTSPIVACL